MKTTNYEENLTQEEKILKILMRAWDEWVNSRVFMKELILQYNARIYWLRENDM